jgi:hypothetical protein
MPGTYLGQKRVLNLGAGFEYEQDRTAHLEQGEPVFNDLELWAIDVFLDLPIDPGNTAVTTYAAFYNYDYGPNLVRNIGANNPASGVDPDEASFNGAGNAYPLVGTGKTFYIQAGFLFPPMGNKGKLGQLQPFADYQSSDFDRLDDRVNAWNLGVNWYIHGQNSKLSLGFQSRPIFFETGTRIEADDRRSMIVLQDQFRLS